jgi:hypothetical protein
LNIWSLLAVEVAGQTGRLGVAVLVDLELLLGFLFLRELLIQ